MKRHKNTWHIRKINKCNQWNGRLAAIIQVCGQIWKNCEVKNQEPGCCFWHEDTSVGRAEYWIATLEMSKRKKVANTALAFCSQWNIRKEAYWQFHFDDWISKLMTPMAWLVSPYYSFIVCMNAFLNCENVNAKPVPIKIPNTIIWQLVTFSRKWETFSSDGRSK